VTHTVRGSAFGTNQVRVERQDPGSGQFQTVALTDQFTVLGKLSVFDVVPSIEPGTFGIPQVVALAATDPGASIFFTTDGSPPTTASSPYTGPITITTTTTLSFVAVSADGQTVSPVHAPVYRIEPAMLTVTALPAGGIFTSAQEVVLAANDASAGIFYTVDGSDPTPLTGTPFSGPISLAHNGDVVLKFIAAGATSTAVQTERYSIRIPLLTAGPVDPGHGFPVSYADGSRALGLCLGTAAGAAGPLCLLPPASPGFDPAQPLQFPGNFPDESFYFSATGSVTVPPTATSPGGPVQLTLALEAAFASGAVQPGQQITFGRVRIRGGGLQPGRYRVVHPYGADFFEVADAAPKSINFTEDVLPIPGSFTGTQGSRIGPFLVWDPALAPAAPAGFVGDPGVPHAVVGSPLGTNFLAVQRWTGLAWQELARTDLFLVMGALAAAPPPPAPPPPAPAPAPPPPVIAPPPGAGGGGITAGGAPAGGGGGGKGAGKGGGKGR
jgi:hypothetical protein